ncbi:MAG: MBL fold metallo-hydrolase [Candidatus Manganitrophaceae bacterium]|nr:MAG: MBL fold metallo-hydrolase [Candidatus Manganitrophaceae bacterium]
MFMEQLFVEGIGHYSYLLGSDENDEAIVIDPDRDIDRYLDLARTNQLRIAHIFETHLHNDYVSGARALAERTGAKVYASAGAQLGFDHVPLKERDTVDIGELRFIALETPGHTPEHVAYLLADRSRSDAPMILFSGGDLLVGAVGRPDLLGPELAKTLAPQLYHSLKNKILKEEDYLEVFPTHGAGSFCGKNISNKRCTTLGFERHFNIALQQPTEGAFVDYVLKGNPGIPDYFRRLRETNRAGQAETPLLTIGRPLTVEEVALSIGRGTVVIDARSSAAFGGGHLPGAINIGLSDSFVTWLGWLIPHDRSILFVLEADRDYPEVVRRLYRIGHERIEGYLQGGMKSWLEAGRPIASVPQLSIETLKEKWEKREIETLVDVRLGREWEAGHIEGAVHLFLGEIEKRIKSLSSSKSTAVICGSGYRSSIAASLLKRSGFAAVYNVVGGMTAWKKAGYPTAA